ncbi:unnamed protein product [Oikopleura dioica]|uniref:Uncharacterized protein n=1 Tax=Oikopleura dioica TaxID=34765 RepID=E4X4A4_OIKDI|nr:unnamed protein product [Oikopleura dioica]CBY39697.1 unnamed protein product [Oikopleura dioica]
MAITTVILTKSARTSKTENGWKCGPSDIECPTEVSAAEWKGRKNTRYLFKSEDSVTLIVKYRSNNRLVNPRTELYKGFVFWTKDVCGLDFSRKLRNGLIGVHLSDTTDVYKLGDSYFKDDGKRSLVGFEFELTQVVDQGYTLEIQKRSTFEKYGV